jgi:hemoglobin
MAGKPPGPDRRAQFTAHMQDAVGVDEAMIARLVHGFYALARRDAVLGPIFEARVADWPAHLERMEAFWSSVMLMSGRYHGQPMTAHATLPIDADHFDRWLALFERSARTICPETAADAFLERARRIAESLELGIAGQNGRLLGRGERYRRAKSSLGSQP